MNTDIDRYLDMISKEIKDMKLKFSYFRDLFQSSTLKN